MARRYDDEAELVQAALQGDGDAFTTLFRRWFDPCVEVARRIVRDEETAAEVAQETFLVAWRQLSTLRDPGAFGGWVLRTSRNKALNRLDRERRSIAVDQDDDPALAGLVAVDDVAGDVAALDQQRLVWAASAALGEREASVLDLHLRHGLDAGEIAAELDITPNNAHQVLFRMKGKLAGAIRAWVLYKGGDPSCPDLRAALESAGATTFSAATVKVIDRHVSACDDCARRQAAILAPEAMFAAVPALPVAGLLREQAASALRESGVPLGADASVPASETSESAGGEGSAEAGGPDGGPGGTPPVGPPDAPVTVAEGSAVAVGADRSTPSTRVLFAIAVGVVLLVVAGLVVATRGGDEADLADAVETTTPDTEPRSGTSVPASDLPLVEPTTTTTAAPTTTTRPVPTTTAPPVVAPPVTQPPPPAPPQVLGFTATQSGTCAAGGFSFTLVWSTSAASSVSVVPSAPLPGGQPVVGGPQGTATACALTPGATWTLTATGPGGTATATD